jgi:hypothetical protein
VGIESRTRICLSQQRKFYAVTDEEVTLREHARQNGAGIILALNRHAIAVLSDCVVPETDRYVVNLPKGR